MLGPDIRIKAFTIVIIKIDNSKWKVNINVFIVINMLISDENWYDVWYEDKLSLYNNKSGSEAFIVNIFHRWFKLSTNKNVWKCSTHVLQFISHKTTKNIIF